MRGKDTARFIATVRDHPPLWNQSHPDYKDKENRDRLWAQIAQQLDIGNGDIAKTKWRNIRDSYVKYLKALKLGMSTTKYNTWAMQMEFLMPHISGRQSIQTSNGCTDDTSMDTLEDKEGEAGLMESMMKQEVWEEEGTISQNGSDLIIGQVTGGGGTISSTADFVSANATGAALATAGITPAAIVDSSLDLTFLGYARSVQRLSRTRQAHIKFHIAQIIHEAEMEEINELETRNNSDR